MTAEIAIANKSAVALAADSKVTIGGSRNAKTYDSVNKVFTLSKTHPVGIMIFGNAEFMDYPWETIIKLYRREKGSDDKDYVEGWSADFQKYLEQFGKIEDHHRRENVKAIVTSWLFQLEEVATATAAADRVARPSPEYDGVLLRTVENYTKRLSRHKAWLSKARARAFLKAQGAAIMEAIHDVFGIEDQDDPLFKASTELAVSALLTDADSPQSSGFVIAGFGAKEYFPTVFEHNTDGFVGNQLKLRRGKAHDISRSMSAYVGAFAQKDMVQNFMNGFDSSLIEKMTGGFNEIVINSCLNILDTYGLKSKKTEHIRSVIRDAAAERVSNLIGDFVNDSRERFSGPVVEMVSLLPKDELAHLAESLVALTSLKRRVSREIETVGGPVDVALISKGDGFVWIKRKHYFRPEINPQFVRNYMDDVRKG